MNTTRELRHQLQQRRAAAQGDAKPFTQLAHYTDENVEVPAPGMPGMTCASWSRVVNWFTDAVNNVEVKT